MRYLKVFKPLLETIIVYVFLVTYCHIITYLYNLVYLIKKKKKLSVILVIKIVASTPAQCKICVHLKMLKFYKSLIKTRFQEWPYSIS